jgi:hypothetical protein
MFKAFLLTNDLFRHFSMRGENAATVTSLDHGPMQTDGFGSPVVLMV